MWNSKATDKTEAAEAAVSTLAGEQTVQVKIGGKARTIILPSDEEDAAITAAALADPDNPPLTDKQLAQLKPARRMGRPPQDATKVPTSIRLDNIVLDSFKATGEGWQTRVNAALLEYLAGHRMLAHRFHATVHNRERETEQLGEFLVVAADEGQAEEKVKRYLMQLGREEEARGQVVTVDVGNARMADLEIIY